MYSRHRKRYVIFFLSLYPNSLYCDSHECLSFYANRRARSREREREAPYRFGLRWFSSCQGDTSTILYFRMLIFTSRSMSQVDRNVIDIRADKAWTKNWYRSGASSERHFLSLAQSHKASSGLMVYCRQDGKRGAFQNTLPHQLSFFNFLRDTHMSCVCSISRTDWCGSTWGVFMSLIPSIYRFLFVCESVWCLCKWGFVLFYIQW